MLFRRFGMGLALVALGFSLGVWVTLPSKQESADKPKGVAPIAGGSATGNALEIAKATIQIRDTLVSISLPVPSAPPLAALNMHADTAPLVVSPVLSGFQGRPLTLSFDGQVLDPDGDGLGLGSTRGPDPWEGRKDSLSAPLSVRELRLWLTARKINYLRAFMIAPGANAALAHEGLEGPAFPDLSGIPGGIQPGDLILYRKGQYSSSTQIPSMRFCATAGQPLVLLGWPGEQATLMLPTGLELDGAAHWRIVGLEWSGNLRNSQGISFEDCSFRELVSQDSRNLLVRGSLFRDSLASVGFLHSANATPDSGSLRLQTNLFVGPSVVIRGFHGDSLWISSNMFLSRKAALQLRQVTAHITIQNNVVIGSGQGCFLLDSLSGPGTLIRENSMWNRLACVPDSCANLLRTEGLSRAYPLRLEKNLILDEGGSIVNVLDSLLQFQDNILFSRPLQSPAWLAPQNRIQDPGFQLEKQL